MATARKAARQVPFMEDVVAGYYCALDPSTPAKVRATLLAALAYFVLPLDTIPDFYPGHRFWRRCHRADGGDCHDPRAHMRDDHYDAAREALKDGDL